MTWKSTINSLYNLATNCIATVHYQPIRCAVCEDSTWNPIASLLNKCNKWVTGYEMWLYLSPSLYKPSQYSMSSCPIVVYKKVKSGCILWILMQAKKNITSFKKWNRLDVEREDARLNVEQDDSKSANGLEHNNRLKQVRALVFQ